MGSSELVQCRGDDLTAGIAGGVVQDEHRSVFPPRQYVQGDEATHHPEGVRN